MSGKNYLLWLDEVSSDDVYFVGSKAAHLGEMLHAKLPIPLGFVVTGRAYKEFLNHNRINFSIMHTLNLVNYENSSEISQASAHIQSLIYKSEMPTSVAAEITHYYDRLKEHEENFYKKHQSVIHQAFHRLSTVYKSPLVSIKPSVTTTKNFSFHTEQIENIQGEIELMLKIKECWAEMYSQRALFYAHEHGLDFEKLINAVVVQQMIHPDRSGYAQSIDPLGNDRNKLIVEAVSGSSKSLKEARVLPDRYIVDKKSMIILEKEIQTEQMLSEEEIWKVAMLIKNVENYFYFPQVIEWAISGHRVFLIDNKPLTNIHTAIAESQATPLKDITLRGTPASPGIAIGHVCIMTSPHDFSQFKKDDILVMTEATSLYLPFIKKAAAIITEKGGQTSYAAQMAHHLGIPAIVGVEYATRLLRQDYVVSVNGKTGEITKGNIHLHKELSELKSGSTKVDSIKTLTKVYATLNTEEDLKTLEKSESDGIGLLKAEDIFLKIGTHPLEFIHQNKHDTFVRKIAEEVQKVCQNVASQPVMYRLCNFTSNEYRNLKAGILYEAEELNPLLGYRGASRLVEQTEILLLELQALKKVREMGYKNLQIIVPFIRVPWELIRIKELIAEIGLDQSNGFKLWMTVEVPSTAILLKEFIEIGLDGVCIETNNLTSMILGVDKTNARLSHLFDPRNPAVTSVIDYVLETSREHDLACTIVGEAVSDYPDFVERVVRHGAMGVVVRPEAIHRTRAVIYAAEKKIHSL